MYKVDARMNVKRTNTIDIQAYFTNDDDSPLDITGYSISAHIRDGRAKILSATNPSIIDAAGGVVSLSVVDTAALKNPSYLDLRLTKGGVITNTGIVALDVHEVVTDG